MRGRWLGHSVPIYDLWGNCVQNNSDFNKVIYDMRLAVSGGQPLFIVGLPMFALTLVDFLSLLWAPSTNI